MQKSKGEKNLSSLKFVLFTFCQKLLTLFISSFSSQICATSKKVNVKLFEKYKEKTINIYEALADVESIKSFDYEAYFS